MIPYDCYIEEGSPFASGKLLKLKSFLTECGLDYDEQIEFTVTLCSSNGEILCTGSRHKNILKCLAISDELQGEGYLDTIMSHLITNAYSQQYTHLFIYTKPDYASIFSSYGFYNIIHTSEVLLMENKANGIKEYINKELSLCPYVDENAKIGAIVMNANPFTNGHLYLIEQALKKCDLLHLFILSSQGKGFSAEMRYELVKQGITHLNGVYLHKSSDYLISHATFPNYFIKDKKQASTVNGELDLALFCAYFKEAFHIQVRFIGEEPLCVVTNNYNQQMKKTLPEHGISVEEIPRLKSKDTVISATTVRNYLEDGKLSAIEPLVPPSTYRYLLSLMGVDNE